MDNLVYLPLVKTPALRNGDFEQGATGWTQSSTNGRTLIRTSFAPNTVTPHSGMYGVWLGGAFNETSTIQQLITVEGGAPYLAYWHWIGSADFCGFDYGYVLINSTAVDTLELCDNNDTNGWVKRVVNLTAYAGQSVTLRIRATTNGSLNSNWFIDDVAFKATASGLVSEQAASTGLEDAAFEQADGEK